LIFSRKLVDFNEYSDPLNRSLNQRVKASSFQGGQNENTRIDRFDYGHGFKWMRIHGRFRSVLEGDKRGLGSLLEGPGRSRPVSGGHKRELEIVLEGPGRSRSVSGGHKRELEIVLEGPGRSRSVLEGHKRELEMVFELINA
jgi:hypothetical protein